ncbi:tRNA pseudouridine(13) synthase TruD [soil metagenome]
MKLRRTPEDFRVTELLTEDWSSRTRPAPGRDAPLALYALQKRSLTTPDACAHFARALGVPPGCVNWAGLKDKHGITTQHITLAHPSPRAILPAHLKGETWSARRVGFHPWHLAAAAIAGNLFEITARALDISGAAQVRTNADFLATPADPTTLRFTNVFGAQRFAGVARDEIARTAADSSAPVGASFAGRALAQGDYPRAIRLLAEGSARPGTDSALALAAWGDWPRMLADHPPVRLRPALEVLAAGGEPRDAFAAWPFLDQQFAVEAYQSLLWNQTARGVISATFPADACINVPDRLTAALHPTPEFAQPATDALASVEIPMLCGRTVMLKPWADFAKAALRAEGILVTDLKVKGLRRPAFREALRPLFAHARAFSISSALPDDLAAPGSSRALKLDLRFELPRGTYATVLLAALARGVHTPE